MNTNPTEHDELLNFMKSLADAERLKIAGLLGVKALTVNQVAERLGMKPAEVAHHFEVLLSAGLAHKEGDGFRLDSQAFESSPAGCWRNHNHLRLNMKGTNSRSRLYAPISPGMVHSKPSRPSRKS